MSLSDKEHKRNLRQIAKAIAASNERLRAAGIRVKGAERAIYVPEPKPQIRPRATSQPVPTKKSNQIIFASAGLREPTREDPNKTIGNRISEIKIVSSPRRLPKI
jgi:hypothetical protein